MHRDIDSATSSTYLSPEYDNPSYEAEEVPLSYTTTNTYHTFSNIHYLQPVSPGLRPPKKHSNALESLNHAAHKVAAPSHHSTSDIPQGELLNCAENDVSFQPEESDSTSWQCQTYM